MLRLFVLCATLAAASAGNTCVCCSNNSVKIYVTPPTDRCGEAKRECNKGDCFPAKDGKLECNTTRGDTVELWEFEVSEPGVSDGSGWSNADDLIEVDCDDTSHSRTTGAKCGDVKLITRAEWGARNATSTTPLNLPLEKHFVHHSAGSHCTTEAACSEQVRIIQDYHMDENKWSDIGYNWLVGEDGNIYEGRGWNNQGAHASGWNDESHGTCVIGTFTSDMPNDAALNALQSIIDCGIVDGATISDYKLHGHRDGVCTDCPGDYMYENWVEPHPHYGDTLDGACLKEEWGSSILYN